MLSNARALTRLIHEQAIALVHARSRGPAWSALIAARRTRIPFVATYHGIYNAGNAAKRFYNSVMVRGQAVIANSEWTAAHIRAVHGALPKRIVTIPRGLDLAHFDPAHVAPERVRAMRANWGAGPDTRVVLLPGRITRWKGHLVFIAALAALKARGALPDNVRAVMAGDAQGRADYPAELRAAIAAHELEDSVLIAGHVTDMPAAYLAADIIVSASTDPEAFGRVPPEAAAMGRAVIATDHGGARETVLPNRSGLLVKPGDAPALADALAGLLARAPGDLDAMGAAGRGHIAAHFTVERMAADTLALYRELTGCGMPPLP
jgi:glycosyltransferase involved in cell wall biosynthesis